MTDIVDHLEPGDVLVVNDTRVLPARLSLQRATGGSAEVLLLEPRDSTHRTWEAMVRPARKLKDGEVLEYFGTQVPYQWSHSPLEVMAGTGVHGIINIPALAILLILGLALPSRWAGLILLLPGAFLAWLAALSWPATSTAGRGLRLLAVALVFGAALARLFDVLGGALTKNAPELNTAAGYGTSPYMLYSGWGEKGDFFYAMEILYGGIPGRPIGDGMDGHSWWPLFENIPTEYLEAYYPLRIDGYTTVTDSGGPGLHRGGNGVEKRYVYLEPGEVSIHDDRWLTRPWGVLGGLPGGRSEKILKRVDGSEERLPSKCDEIEVQPGDMLVYRTAGGGGWNGDVELRVPVVSLSARLLVERLAHVQALREAAAVQPLQAVAHLEACVLRGAGEPVVGARAAEREQVAARLQHAERFLAPGAVPLLLTQTNS